MYGVNRKQPSHFVSHSVSRVTYFREISLTSWDPIAILHYPDTNLSVRNHNFKDRYL
jgi:hypothetical protein